MKYRITSYKSSTKKLCVIKVFLDNTSFYTDRTTVFPSIFTQLHLNNRLSRAPIRYLGAARSFCLQSLLSIRASITTRWPSVTLPCLSFENPPI
ncbi:hypothetical protein CDAR_57461 [Caerostris darwini]|uniref:Uncharacterized protein n=1 Tax=Caerostris darwini TaxID=1538125 RepID=A0AAV4SXJ0_9ARAC|nr:hypothetical protein CDAR_57461 [Caerostris darwini]